MKKRLVVVLLLLSFVAVVVAGCGTTPEPTEPAPTQTPWIIVVTATPGRESVAEVLPTQTPWIIVATPTSQRKAQPTGTEPTGTEPTGTEPKATEPKSTKPAARATAGGEESVQPTETAAPANTTPPKPTRTPAPSTRMYPPPTLREPSEGMRVPWKSMLTLEWEPVGELAEDEYYRVDLHRLSKSEGMSEYGDSVLSKEPSAVFERTFLAAFHPPEVQGDAEVQWWVTVVRKSGEDENGKPISQDLGAPSEKRTLVFDPKPEDA